MAITPEAFSLAVTSGAGVDFYLMGMGVDVASLTFDSDRRPHEGNPWDPELTLQGKLVMPEALGGFELAVEGDNKVLVNSEGVVVSGGKLTLPGAHRFTALGLLEVETVDASLEFSVGENFARLQGTFTLPTVFGITADFSGDNYFKISEADGVEVRGTLSTEDIVLVPGVWELKNVSVEIDTINKSIKGEVDLLIPTGIIVEAGLGFIGGELDFVSLGADKVNKPIGSTGAFLQRIEGSVDHIAEADPTPIEFAGGLGVTAGPQKTISLPSWAGGTFEGFLVRLDVDGRVDKDHITGDGVLQFVGGLANATGHAELIYSPPSLRGNGTFNFLGDVVTMTSGFTVKPQMDISMLGEAAIRLPDIFPLNGREIASGTGRFEFRNDSVATNDYVAGFGTVDLGWFGELVLGVKVDFAGNVSIINGMDDLPGAGAMAAVAFRLKSAAERSFVVGPSTDPAAAFGPMGKNDVAEVAVQIQSPDGTVYTEADFGGMPTMGVIPELGSVTSEFVGVLDPAEGVWTIRIVDTTDLGATEFCGSVDSEAPPYRADHV